MTNETMPDGYLSDVHGNLLLASCLRCAYLDDVSDSEEYGSPIYQCTKDGRRHVSNMKSFPFNTPQKCCELNTSFMVDWSEEAKKERLGI
jgi:hypothetical protein